MGFMDGLGRGASSIYICLSTLLEASINGRYLRVSTVFGGIYKWKVPASIDEALRPTVSILVALEKNRGEFDDSGWTHPLVAVNRPAVKYLWGMLVGRERVSYFQHVHHAWAR